MESKSLLRSLTRLWTDARPFMHDLFNIPHRKHQSGANQLTNYRFAAIRCATASINCSKLPAATTAMLS